MPPGQPVERIGRKTEEVAVADGVHIERRGAAAQHERLAEGAPPEVLEDEVPTPVAVDVGGAQPAPLDKDERDAGLPPVDDARAPGHVDPLEGSVQVLRLLGIDRTRV